MAACTCTSPASTSIDVRGAYDSPLDAMRLGPREKLIYIPAVMINACGGEEGSGGQKPDYLATVDVDPKSPSYSNVVHRLPMPSLGDELHHMGWNACCSCRDRATHAYLVAPGVVSGNVHIIDVKTDPRTPTLFKVIEASELAAIAGVAVPHTSHCTPTEIVMSFLGGPREDGFAGSGNGFVTLDPHTFEVTGRWERGASKSRFGYDFWYQPRHNVMISSEWGEPSSWLHGFDPAHVVEGKYGSKIYVWDWSTHELKQELDCGVGSIPLEVRFLHEPARAEGFVGCALSSEMVRFFQKSDGIWDKHVAVKIPAIKVTGWVLPEMPALITDFVISLDDHFMYLACWLHGDVRQYDISGDNIREPRLVGQCFIGGSLKKGGPVSLVDGGEQPEPLVVKGVEIQGGAQMVQLSLDGRRLYVSTSLLSSWDRQFYPEMSTKGAQLLQLDVDTEKGGLAVNPEFLIDFGSEPFGPARCHEMRLPGGDCTSDIWL